MTTPAKAKAEKNSFRGLLLGRYTRVPLCRHSVFAFALFYFTHYFFRKGAPFHFDMAKDLKFDGIDFLIWVMFRDSAKTTWAKIKAVHAICYEYKHNIGWVGYDLRKAKKQILSIANELQTNKKIINDFGQLFFEPDSPKNKKSKPKQMSEFVTENGVYVKALSTKVSTRGDLHDEFRPDMYIIDDIENEITKRSFTITSGIINFLEELIAGKSVNCDILILGNKITNSGTIAYLEDKAKMNPNWKVRNIAVQDKTTHKLTWPSKFVKTDKEAEKINKVIEDKRLHMISLETVRRDLGSARYFQEMMNEPIRNEDAIVKRDWVQYYHKSRLIFSQDGNIYYHFEGDEKPTKGRLMVAIDPAISKKETSDERAIAVVGKFIRKQKTADTPEDAKYLLLKVAAGHWSMSVFAQKLGAVRDMFRPEKIGCESNGVQEVFRELFAMHSISTIALNPDGDKVRRLSRHLADFEFGNFLFPDDGSEMQTIDELTNFTGEPGAPDNRVDAISYAMDMLKNFSKAFIFQSI